MDQLEELRDKEKIRNKKVDRGINRRVKWVLSILSSREDKTSVCVLLIFKEHFYWLLCCFTDNLIKNKHPFLCL